MVWEKRIPTQFCKFIYLNNNFMWLCQVQITFQKANVIVKNFIEEDEANIELLRQFLEKHAVIFQFIYANLFPKVYVRNNHFGIHNKSIFEFTYREWYCEKKIRQKKNKTIALPKQPQQWEKIQMCMSKDLPQMLVNLNNDLKK